MKNEKAQILIIDDEISVRHFLRHTLEAHGFIVFDATSAKEGLAKITEIGPDLIILDYGLPDSSGLEVLKNLRAWSQIPVLFLTVRNSEADKVQALDAGADDYLTKPFGTSELLARIRVALRHSHATTVSPLVRTDGLEINLSVHQVKVLGNEIKVTNIEYALLRVLGKNLGKIVPHRTILKEVWGPNMVEHSHYLRVYFGHLRKKLDAAKAGTGELIENESGVGYRLAEKDSNGVG